MLEEDEEQSLKVFLEQLWVWSVSDFIFLALAYEDGWLVLSLAESSSHLQYAVSVFIIAELARGAGDLATISTLTVRTLSVGRWDGKGDNYCMFINHKK